MPLKTILKNIGGTIRTVTEFVEDEVIDPISNEFEYRAKELEQFRANTFGTAEPGSWEMQTSNLVQKAVDASVVGVAEQGAIILGGNTAETVGLPRGVGEFVGGALAPGLAAPAPSAITRATRAATKNSVKTAIKETAEGLKTIGDDLMPPPPAALATAGVAPRMQLNVSRGKANLAPQVMEIASDMKPANWSTSVRSLQKSGATAQDIEKVLSKPYQKNLNKKYEAISLKELSEDKGGWLEMLMDRQDEFNANHKQYMKTKKATDQRKMYDNYTDVQGEQQMYDNNNPIRKAVTATFNTVAGKEWHHIFGNKEAAETMLSAVTQDPYIAVNLIHYLKKIKLPTSGTPSNIALMNKALHRKKGGYHSWAKNLGIENAGKRKGDLVISDYVQEISKGILNGTADVNEIFSIIETYAKLNNQVIKPKLKADFGASIISEMDPVMRFVQGVKPSNK